MLIHAATRNEVTQRLKPPKVTTFAALPIGTAIGTSRERLRMVANGCARLRTQTQRRANTPSTQKPAECNENPCYAFGKKQSSRNSGPFFCRPVSPSCHLIRLDFVGKRRLCRSVHLQMTSRNQKGRALWRSLENYTFRTAGQGGFRSFPGSHQRQCFQDPSAYVKYGKLQGCNFSCSSGWSHPTLPTGIASAGASAWVAPDFHLPGARRGHGSAHPRLHHAPSPSHGIGHVGSTRPRRWGMHGEDHGRASRWTCGGHPAGMPWPWRGWGSCGWGSRPGTHSTNASGWSWWRRSKQWWSQCGRPQSQERRIASPQTEAFPKAKFPKATRRSKGRLQTGSGGFC